MAEELVYTSATRGLRPGTRGFCTVAYTEGMLPESIKLLESLSAYKAIYPGHDPRAPLNPVAYSHGRFTLRGRSISVLSRVGTALADHTNRSNKIAHHVVLPKRERCSGGPVWLCRQSGFFKDAWDGPPRRLREAKVIPDGDVSTSFAATWEALTGDAGWAGAMAYASLTRPTVPVFVIYEPGVDVLALFGEAMAVVPVEYRWNITFSTYFSTLAAGTTCLWRGCVAGPEAYRESRRNPRALSIDLSRSQGAPPPASPLVTCAREGTLPPPGFAGGRTADARSSFVVLPNRHRNALRMASGKHEDHQGNDTGRATGPTDS